MYSYGFRMPTVEFKPSYFTKIICGFFRTYFEDTHNSSYTNKIKKTNLGVHVWYFYAKLQSKSCSSKKYWDNCLSWLGKLGRDKICFVINFRSKQYTFKMPGICLVDDKQRNTGQKVQSVNLFSHKKAFSFI